MGILVGKYDIPVLYRRVKQGYIMYIYTCMSGDIVLLLCIQNKEVFYTQQYMPPNMKLIPILGVALRVRSLCYVRASDSKDFCKKHFTYIQPFCSELNEFLFTSKPPHVSCVSVRLAILVHSYIN